jgi:hypothetical protein
MDGIGDHRMTTLEVPGDGPVMENLQPTSGLLERHYKNMQDDAVITDPRPGFDGRKL